MLNKGTTKMLAVLFCAAFIAAFNENSVNVGLTDIMSEFDVDANTANWLITGYMVITSIVVTTVAFLLKRFKIRTLFFVAAGVFVVGCGLAFFAPSFPLLLGCRLLQAVGTGIFIPTMMSTVLAVAPRKKLGVYLAIGSCCITFGPAVGPVISGLMVTFFGWRTIFLVPMATMTCILLAGIVFIKNVNETTRVKFDAPSLILSILGLTAVVYGLSQIFGNTLVAVIILVAGLVILAAFVLRQGRIEYPLMNLQPLKNPRFSIACILVVVAMMTTFSMSVLLPLYFVGAAGTSALIAGALVLVPILAQAATAVVGGKIMDSKGEWPLLPAGFLLVTIGLVVVCLVAGSLNLVLVVIAATVVYAGVGLAFSPSQTAGLKKLPPDMNPYGVSIMSTFIQVAAALGPSLFVGVLSSTTAETAASGVQANIAQATGFSAAIFVAAIIGAIGFVVAFVYSRKMSRVKARDQRLTKRKADNIPEELTLEHVMKKEVYTVPDTAPIYQAVNLMLEYQTSGLPVVDSKNSVVGFISGGDIMKALSDKDSSLIDLTYALTVYANDKTFDERRDAVMHENVMELATMHVISVDIDTPIKQVCTVLGERRIKKVPVLSKGRLVGTVSRSDVTRYLFNTFASKGRVEASEQ